MSERGFEMRRKKKKKEKKGRGKFFDSSPMSIISIAYSEGRKKDGKSGMLP